MFKLNTKNGIVNVYAKTVEKAAIEQIMQMANTPLGEDAHICIMPDVHAGKGCTIGTTMYVTDKVCPNLVGVDIGCGMYVAKLEMTAAIQADFSLFLRSLDMTINRYVPTGRAVNEQPHHNAVQFAPYLTQLCCTAYINQTYVLNSVGTLGGGNHFIELDVDSHGNYYIVVHSGSRHLGTEVARYYQKKAEDNMSKSAYKKTSSALIAKYKAEGRQQEISQALASLQVLTQDVPKELSYCTGTLVDSYMHDIDIVQDYAQLNRKTIVQEISERWCGTMSQRPRFKPCFTTIHNYIDVNRRILRKGAVSAKQYEMLLIPMNMRDGSLLCCGKGNPEWNYSAPHGAGRLYSRKQANECLSLQDFKNTMCDVYTTSVCKETLDEAPAAYKPMQEIIDCIADTVTVLDVLKPVYNYKAH